MRVSRLSCLVVLLGAAMVHAESAPKERLEVNGRLMLDADYFGALWSKQGAATTSDAEVRSARLELNYDFPKGWVGELQIEATLRNGETDLDVGSAWLRYTRWQVADITFGRTKEPVGLERNTSGESLLTIERSMMSTALAPGKSWGIHLDGGNDQLHWGIAAVVEDDQDNNDYPDAEPQALSGRVQWFPAAGEAAYAGIGLSVSLRDWKENIFQIRDRGEIGTANRVVRSAAFVADTQTLVGLEGVWQRNSWLLQGEYMMTRLKAIDGSEWNYGGYYLTASHFLTGDAHRFKQGKLRSVKPASDTAWELVARYSALDARDHDLGAEAEIVTLGVNGYFGRHVKLMLAYLRPAISGSVWHTEPDGDGWSARLQFSF